MVDVLDSDGGVEEMEMDEKQIQDKLLQFASDTNAIKSYTSRLMSYIFTHEITDINDLIDEFRNLVRNQFLEDSDDTYEYRDGLVEYIQKLKLEINELKQFEHKYIFDETFIRDYNKIFIEDFVIASNILNIDLDALFEDENDRLVIKCTSIIAHKLFKHDDCMKKMKKMNYHTCFEKPSTSVGDIAQDLEKDDIG